MSLRYPSFYSHHYERCDDEEEEGEEERQAKANRLIQT